MCRDGVHLCHFVHTELREQLERVISVFLPCGFGEWNSVISLVSKHLYPLPTEPYKNIFLEVDICTSNLLSQNKMVFVQKKSEKVRANTAYLNQILKG